MHFQEEAHVEQETLEEEDGFEDNNEEEEEGAPQGRSPTTASQL
jgi:hypothetical protein